MRSGSSTRDVRGNGLYAALQVQPSAEPEVIEAAYRALARKYHPDVNAAPEAAQRMRDVIAAYQVLSDPQRRAEYDRTQAGRVAYPTESVWSRDHVKVPLALLLQHASLALFRLHAPRRAQRVALWVVAAGLALWLGWQLTLGYRQNSLPLMGGIVERQAVQAYWRRVEPVAGGLEAARARYLNVVAPYGSFGSAAESTLYRSISAGYAAELERAVSALRSQSRIPQRAATLHFALLQQWTLELDVVRGLNAAAATRDFAAWTRTSATEIDLQARQRESAAALAELRAYLRE